MADRVEKAKTALFREVENLRLRCGYSDDLVKRIDRFIDAKIEYRLLELKDKGGHQND